MKELLHFFKGSNTPFCFFFLLIHASRLKKESPFHAPCLVYSFISTALFFLFFFFSFSFCFIVLKICLLHFCFLCCRGKTYCVNGVESIIVGYC